MIFSGNANPDLSKQIANHLKLSIGKAVVSTFSDGETMVEIQENVRGRDVFIVQSTSAPTNDHLMELLLLADALRRSSPPPLTPFFFFWVRPKKRGGAPPEGPPFPPKMGHPAFIPRSRSTTQ